MQRGMQRCGETAEEKSMQQPGTPYFHRHSFPLRYWKNVESVSRFRWKGKERPLIWRAEVQDRDAGTWMDDFWRRERLALLRSIWLDTATGKTL